MKFVDIYIQNSNITDIESHAKTHHETESAKTQTKFNKCKSDNKECLDQTLDKKYQGVRGTLVN